MAWSDQQSLFVSFGDTVRVCNVRRRDPNNPRARELPHYMVEILYTVPLEGFWISGLAPMDKLIVLLTSPKGNFQLSRLRQSCCTFVYLKKLLATLSRVS